MRRVVMIGATGLVGAMLADRLLARGDFEVHALLRRPSRRSHRRWRESELAPEEWPEVVKSVAADTAISTLGTTMRAAGSEAAFRQVDLDMVVAFAAAARAAGARHMMTVSSVGADASSANFYLRLKREMESRLEELAFGRLDIFRPGLLRGKRGADRRLGERLGILASPVLNLFLRGRLDRFAAIDADVVAAAMEAVLAKPDPGAHLHHNREIRRLAAEAVRSTEER